MLVMMFVLPESKLNRAQIAKLQELATGFGVLVAKQFNMSPDEVDGFIDEDLDDSAFNALDASDRVVDDDNIIGYLEDCFNRDQ